MTAVISGTWKMARAALMQNAEAQDELPGAVTRPMSTEVARNSRAPTAIARRRP